MAAIERDIAEQDSSRRKIVIIVAIIAAVLIAGLFYLLMRASGSRANQPARLEGAIRPGSPDWEKLSALIVLDDPEADQAKRAIGDTVMTLRTTVRNFTGKTINGLELRAAVVNQQGKAIKERTVIVIPSAEQPELAPNKTVQVRVLLDGMSDTDDRANIKMEITGFRLKP
jgi:hypothetical protein